MKLIETALNFLEKPAIIDDNGTWTYQQLLDTSSFYADKILNSNHDLYEERVAFMVDPGFDYVCIQWAIWRSGGIAVPLCLTHPFPSLQYVIDDTAASTIIVSNSYAEILKNYAEIKSIRFIVLPKHQIFNGDSNKSVDIIHFSGSQNKFPLPSIASDRSAMILYTSGTTNKPKGVVLTHSNLEAQMENLIDAWQWSAADHTLCVLPLHHVHGIVNVVGCSLLSGSTCTFISSFSAEKIFNIFLDGKINVFMAVPTIYYKLITYWESLSETEQIALKKVMTSFRLMVSGSAALPVTTMEKWKLISNHTLLERYGMTEIGMALSNPYNGERRPGYVGIPLPNVEVRLVDDHHNDIESDEQGEIIVRGKNVFKEYWQKPEETKKEFLKGDWFKTGDVAVIHDGYYKIVGRSSIDIIKSGGYKISALEIEEILRSNLYIKDCAVVGIQNEEWGELVVAAVVAKEDFDEKEINTWIRTKLPSYKTPRKYLAVQELPRNAMGKVVKNEVKKLFQ